VASEAAHGDEMKPMSASQRLTYAPVLGAVLLFQSCDRPAAVPPTEPTAGPSEESAVLPPGALTGPVTHVRDGDTIEVAGKPIRLQGLNCNERGTALGEAATTAISRLVENGEVTCELSGEMTYDREVGHVPPGDRRGLGFNPDPARRLRSV
jgi:endonuclease YncB( thermonuclease family)